MCQASPVHTNLQRGCSLARINQQAIGPVILMLTKIFFIDRNTLNIPNDTGTAIAAIAKRSSPTNAVQVAERALFCPPIASWVRRP